MESKIQSLPPLKRFRLLHQHQSSSDNDDDLSMSSSQLPAKKRKESRNLPPPNPTTTTAVCSLLPAKKRVWALPPDFDLNLEFTPPSPDPKSPTPDPKSEAEDEDDDGIVCGVCESTDGEPSDPIVFCDGCDLTVHASCYGSPLIEAVPEGDWFCAQCLANQKGSCCCLCPVRGGALKPTKDGKWAHLVCALYVPEVFFEDPVGREGIDCSRVPQKRFNQMCYVCESGDGCAIECSELNCGLAFHVTCGLNEGLTIEYKQSRSGKAVAIVAGFCKQHTQLWTKQQRTGKFKIVARDDESN